MTDINKKNTTTVSTTIVSSSLPGADALKDRFKAGSIPLQTDFADLIDMANIGRKAVGATTGKALSLDEQSRLQLDVNQIVVKNLDLTNGTGNIEYDVNFDDIDGHPTQLVFLTVDPQVGPTEAVGDSYITNTIFTLPATKVTNGNVENIMVKVRGEKKIGSGSFGMHVSRGGSNTVQPAFKFTLESPNSYVNSQLTIDPLYLEMRYLSGGTGVGVFKRIYQLNFVFNGATQIIPKGLISMFSGSSVPSGWALCDGTNGTPDLRERFIKGSKSLSPSIGGSNTVSFTPEGTVTVGQHKLTIDEMPKHAHVIQFDQAGTGNAGLAVHIFDGINSYSRQKVIYNLGTGSTFPEGESKSHDHPGTFTGKVQKISIDPLYYALAFIMKL